MKSKTFAICVALSFGLLAVPCHADLVPVAQRSTNALVPGCYVSQRDANSRLVQNVTVQTNKQGITVLRTNSYTEIATGLCVFDSNSNAWVDASPVIDAVADGAEAVHTQHTVHWATDVNTQGGAVRLISPGGSVFTSGVYGLSYWDVASGSNVMIAALTNSQGILVGDNQVVYPGSLVGESVAADILYTETLAGMEQNILIKQSLPPPSAWGLSDNTSQLQVLTEFRSSPGAVNVVTNDANGVEDDIFIAFPDMGINVGESFLTQTDGGTASAGQVGKQWLTLDGRQFLVEQIDYQAIAPLLAELPEHASIDKPLKKTSRMAALKEKRPGSSSKSAAAPMRVAKNYSEKPGLVVDYSIVTSSSGFTFQGDTSYYVSSGVSLTGTVTWEGGAVIKYTNGASIAVNPTTSDAVVVFNTSSYRPVICTSKDDNTVGDTIVGSTGSPSGLYASTALALAGMSSPTFVITNMRISYAQQAVSATGCTPLITNVQFVNCSNGVYVVGGTATLDNALFANVARPFNHMGAGQGVVVHNATFSGAAYLATFQGTNSGTYNASFTNCIFSQVTNMGGYPESSPVPFTFSANAGSNGFYSSPSFGSGVVTNTFYPFQSAGGGNYYLTNGCAFVNAGATNLSAALLTDLSQRTTFPPVLLAGGSANVTLSMQAQRDTDLPDLGYHYDPVDWLVDNFAITNATLTVGAGVAIASYNDPGICMSDSSSISAVGTPLSPVWFTRYSSAQEEPIQLGQVSNFTAVTLQPNYVSTPPTALLRFCNFSSPAGGGWFLWDSGASNFSTLTAQDCQFWVGKEDFSGGSGSMAVLRNNQFFRSTVNAASTDSTVGLAVSNNLIYHGTVTLSQPSAGEWFAFNNGFDHCTITNSTLTNGYNGYIPSTQRLSPTNANDVLLPSFTYANGPLGAYYQITTSFVNKGSDYASNVGLYEYTVSKSLVNGFEPKETNTIVDIGFHYVATDSNGIPTSTGADGFADYLKDANGNGAYDGGDIANWKTNSTCGNGSDDYAMYLEGRSFTACSAVADTSGTVNLDVYTPLQ